jgi:hypothetical protein
MHNRKSIRALLDSYGPREAALMIGHLSGVITRKQAITAMRCDPEVAEKYLANAQQAARMMVENAERIDAILGGHGLPASVDEVKD